MKVRSLIMLCAVLLVLSAAVYAHEGRQVGDYEVNFGWRVEPAYVGVFNGPELTITNRNTGAPVQGLDETLLLTAQFGDQTLALRLYPVSGERGHYTADLIPTRPGDYTFVLTGRVGETEVNETFSSADGEFSTVEPSSDILFPALESDAARLDALQAQIEALRAEIEALRAAAGT